MPDLLQRFNVGNEMPKIRAACARVINSVVFSGVLKEGNSATSFLTVSEMTVTNSSSVIGERMIFCIIDLIDSTMQITIKA